MKYLYSEVLLVNIFILIVNYLVKLARRFCFGS